MSVQGGEPFDWDHITFARARVLREIEDRRTEREIADHLQVTCNGMRSQLDELKSITGCGRSPGSRPVVAGQPGCLTGVVRVPG